MKRFRQLAVLALAVQVLACRPRAQSATEVKSQPPSTQPAQPAGEVAVTDAGQAPQSGTGIIINERELTADEVGQLVAAYRARPPKGQFWYDARSGLYGAWGREAAGYIRPGHDFGPLSPNASGGNTGVFINGREINDVELAFLQILFGGRVQRGRAWLDGMWNVGEEGSPVPFTNLAVAIQQAQQRAAGGGSGWGWRDGSGTVAASDGNCTMMAVPGAPVYSSGNC